MTRGRVMKGPTPIISSMLKRTAERRPMRRCRVAGLLDESRFIRRSCSPDCTLTGSMFLSMRVREVAVGAALAGLIAAGAGWRNAAAQQTSGTQKTVLEAIPLPEPAVVALPLA